MRDNPTQPKSLQRSRMPMLIVAALLFTSCGPDNATSRIQKSDWTEQFPPVVRNPIELEPLALDAVVYTEDEAMVTQLESSPGCKIINPSATPAGRTADPESPSKAAMRDNWPEPPNMLAPNPVVLFQASRRDHAGAGHEVVIAAGPCPAVPLGNARA